MKQEELLEMAAKLIDMAEQLDEGRKADEKAKFDDRKDKRTRRAQDDPEYQRRIKMTDKAMDKADAADEDKKDRLYKKGAKRSKREEKRFQDVYHAKPGQKRVNEGRKADEKAKFDDRKEKRAGDTDHANDEKFMKELKRSYATQKRRDKYNRNGDFDKGERANKKLAKNHLRTQKEYKRVKDQGKQVNESVSRFEADRLARLYGINRTED